MMNFLLVHKFLQSSELSKTVRPDTESAKGPTFQSVVSVR